MILTPSEAALRQHPPVTRLVCSVSSASAALAVQRICGSPCCSLCLLCPTLCLPWGFSPQFYTLGVTHAVSFLILIQLSPIGLAPIEPSPGSDITCCDPPTPDLPHGSGHCPHSPFAAIFPPWTQSRHTPDTPQVPRRQLPAGREVKCCHSSSPWESHAQKQKPPLFDGKRKHSEPTEAFC